MKPRMTVKDVFHFEDGRTILSVTTNDDPRLIEAGLYELRQNGRRIQSVHVENEMLTRNPHQTGERSVSLVERVDIPSGRPIEELLLVPDGEPFR